MSEKPTTQTADYWKAEALRQRRISMELKLDIFFEETPADIEIKRAAKATKEQATVAAKKPRPRGINHLAVAIKSAMAPSKKEGLDFKTFMRDWQQEEQQELTLTQLEDNQYTVTDESHGVGNLGALVYKSEGLRSLYTYCLKPRPRKNR